MKCTNCGTERLKNITRQGETCRCKKCGAVFTVRTSADRSRPAVVYCSQLPTAASVREIAAAGLSVVGEYGKSGSDAGWIVCEATDRDAVQAAYDAEDTDLSDCEAVGGWYCREVAR